VQLEWKEERERLAKAREEFEVKMKFLEGGLAKVASVQHQHIGNGEAVKAGGGLVTPPSPRSLSSDSNGSGRRRRRRSSGSRGRVRSRSQNTSTTAVSVSDSETFPLGVPRPYSPDEGASDNEGSPLIRVKTEELHDRDPSADFQTPESSVHQPSGHNSNAGTLMSSVSSVIQAKEEFTDAVRRFIIFLVACCNWVPMMLLGLNY